MSPSRPKILIADSDLADVALLQAYLCELQCEVQTAADGEQTLARLRDDPPHVLVLDSSLRGIPGAEVCRKLKSADTTRRVQIVMMTLLNQVDDIELAVQAGTDDFVIKPVNKLELVARVKSLLRVRRLLDEVT